MGNCSGSFSSRHPIPNSPNGPNDQNSNQNKSVLSEQKNKLPENNNKNKKNDPIDKYPYKDPNKRILVYPHPFGGGYVFY